MNEESKILEHVPDGLYVDLVDSFELHCMILEERKMLLRISESQIVCLLLSGYQVYKASCGALMGLSFVHMNNDGPHREGLPGTKTGTHAVS